MGADRKQRNTLDATNSMVKREEQSIEREILTKLYWKILFLRTWINCLTSQLMMKNQEQDSTIVLHVHATSFLNMLLRPITKPKSIKSVSRCARMNLIQLQNQRKQEVFSDQQKKTQGNFKWKLRVQKWKSEHS